MIPGIEPPTLRVVASTNSATKCLKNTFTIYLHRIQTGALHYGLCQRLCRHRTNIYSSSSKYRQLQILQSKCFRVTGNYSRRTPMTHLHTALNLEPIRDFIFRLTEKCFLNCPTHPNPLVREIGNYSVTDLHRQYKKYIHKRTKHLLL